MVVGLLVTMTDVPVPGVKPVGPYSISQLVAVPRSRQPIVTVEEVADKMAIVPPWAEGLILRADGYSCAYFQKDA